jgi:hypothetical protein
MFQVSIAAEVTLNFLTICVANEWWPYSSNSLYCMKFEDWHN